MEQLSGTIKISNSGSAKIKSGKKTYGVPKKFKLEKSTHHGKSCQFTLVNNLLDTLIIDGVAISPDEEYLKKEEKRKADREFKESAQIAQKEKQARLRSVLNNDLFNSNDSLLPFTTTQFDISNIDFINYGLKLNKYASFNNRDEKFNHSHNQKMIKANFDGVPFEDIAARYREIINACYSLSSVWSMNIKDKFAIGLGAASVYETNLELHPVYGIPYIPASAIKGATRNYLIEQYLEDKYIDEPGMEAKAFNVDYNPDHAQFLCDVFGAPKSLEYKENNKKISLPTFYKKDVKGKIIFCDAFPIILDHHDVQTDVMTPHFTKYYEGNSAPVDYLDPVPVTFLVLKNTRFEFLLATNDSNDLLDKISNEVRQVLKDKGLGAKTAVGYGFFTE